MTKIHPYNSIKTQNFRSVPQKTGRSINIIKKSPAISSRQNSKLLTGIAIASGISLTSILLGFRHFAKMEQKILFDPNITKFNPVPENLKNVMQKINTETEDGINLEHYYIPPTDGKKTIIFCHGKSKNATNHFDVAEFLQQNGYGVLLLEYRGFGKNPGTPSEKGLYKDLDSAVDYLQAHGVPKKQMVLWGFSLGGGVVSEVAQSNKFGGIILNSTFSDMNNAAKHLIDNRRLKLFNNKFAQKTMESLPAEMIPLKNKFRNQAKMKKVQTKTLIMHAKNDPIIPYEMSKKLAETTPNSKLYLSETGRHSTNGWTEETILNFLESLN